jgi:hypothetical protein
MTFRRALTTGLAVLVLPSCSVERKGTGGEDDAGSTTHTGGATGTGGQTTAQGGAGDAAGGAGNAAGGAGDGGSVPSDGSAGSTGGGGNAGAAGTSGADGAIADQRSESSASCGAFPNAQAYGGHCYWASSDTVSWPDASTNCQNDGGDLAGLSTSAEDAWATTTFASVLASDSWLWIGLTDQQALTGTSTTAPYTWANGEAMTYTNWAATQPDHWCGACGAATCCQHRGVLGADGAWYDRSDTDLNAYLCEAVP